MGVLKFRLGSRRFQEHTGAQVPGSYLYTTWQTHVLPAWVYRKIINQHPQRTSLFLRRSKRCLQLLPANRCGSSLFIRYQCPWPQLCCELLGREPRRLIPEKVLLFARKDSQCNPINRVTELLAVRQKNRDLVQDRDKTYLLQSFQTSSRTHPTSYSIYNWSSFPLGKSDRKVKPITHYLTPRSRMTGVLPPLGHMPSWIE
jgi:hypothetical protein